MSAVVKELHDESEEINEEHRLASASFQSGLEHAIRCGDLLIQQKARLRHGEFIPWVKAHCEFSYETAKVYMLAAREKGRGLSFSSLKQLINYERPLSTSRVSRPPQSIYSEYYFPSQPPDDLVWLKKQDPDAAHYQKRVKNYLEWMVKDFRKVIPAAVVQGALPDDLKAMRTAIREIHRISADLHQSILSMLFGFGGREPTPLDAMSYEERDEVLWGVIKEVRLAEEDAKKLMLELDPAPPGELFDNEIEIGQPEEMTT